MTSCTPRASARNQLQPCVCSRNHLPFLFHITSVSFLLRILAEKVAASATFTDCVAFTGKRWAAEEEEAQVAQQSPPRALTPEGSADTLSPVTPGHTLAQPSTHHMFLLECHDTSPSLLHVGLRTPQASAGTGLPSWPLQPLQADTKEWDLAP